MPRVPKKLSKAAYGKPTYEEFRQAAIKEHGSPPIGIEMLQYWEMHPDVEKEMCPNPVRKQKVKA